jgi:hypothetical protein
MKSMVSVWLYSEMKLENLRSAGDALKEMSLT